MRSPALWCALCLTVAGASGIYRVHGQGAGTAPPSDVRLVLRKQAPRDSQGELIYESARPGSSKLEYIAGDFAPPRVIAYDRTHMPADLKANSVRSVELVEGVVSTNGRIIDMVALNPPNAAAGALALATAAGYRFQPATLNGKPIAYRTRLEVHFLSRPNQK